MALLLLLLLVLVLLLLFSPKNIGYEMEMESFQHRRTYEIRCARAKERTDEWANKPTNELKPKTNEWNETNENVRANRMNARSLHIYICSVFGARCMAVC